MAKIEIKFQDDYWVSQDENLDRLREAGYTAAKYGEKYVLYRIDTEKVRFKVVGEFDTPEELNQMLNLIVEGS
jgi:regulatory protein YycI of two-component signal transduction system YycFG